MQVEAGTDTVQVLAHVFGPIEDQVKKWEIIAAKEYQFDGLADGWDSDVEEEETPEQKYIKVKFWTPACSCNPCWHCFAIHRETPVRLLSAHPGLQRMSRITVVLSCEALCTRNALHVCVLFCFNPT